jgi:polar amino acid transport system permease protein
VGVTGNQIDWGIVLSRLFQPDATFLGAVAMTVVIAVIAQALGVVLGVLSALAWLSKVRPLRLCSFVYTLVFRGTPIIVQIFFVYFGAAIFLGFDPFPRTAHILFLTVSGSVVAGIVALSLNEGAFMSEIMRAGIMAVDAGQKEAATSLGMTSSLAMRRIILPQAARIIIPPLGNEFNSMLKTTSLLAFIGVYEMFLDADIHYSQSFRPAEYFLAVAIWYLLLTGIWSLIQIQVERRFNRGQPGSDAGESMPWWERLVGVQRKGRA